MAGGAAVSYGAAVWVSTVTRDWFGSMDCYGVESRRNCFSQRGSRSWSSNLDRHGRLRCSGKEIDGWFIYKRINAGPPWADLAGAGAGEDRHDAGEGPSRVMVGSSA
jgi:hypothetical protein